MNSRRRISACAVLVLLGCAAAAARELPITTKVLRNGCTLAVVENHQAPVVALRVYITNTGSLYEGEFLGSGISHYVEQVVHGGTTTTRTEAETARLLQSMGASTSAYTSQDVTCFFGETHVAHFDLMLELFADWVQNCALDPREVEREKEVVKKEVIKERDEPDRVAYQLLTETMYRTSPARLPTIGYLDNFLRLTRVDLRKFYRDHYAPNHTVVVVGGDVDPKQALEKLESAFALWERRSDAALFAHLPHEPRQMGRRLAETEMDVQEAFVRFGFHTIELSHRDLYALDLFAAVLGNGRTSRLHRRVVERDHLTDRVQVASYTPHHGPGIFHVISQCPYWQVPAFEKALFEEIERLGREPPLEEEIDRAKTLVERDFVLNRLRAADQAELVAFDLIGTGNPNYSARYVRGIRAVSAQQVQAMARTYFARENETLVVVKPRGEPSAFDAKAPGASSTAKVPSARTRKLVLDNGLAVVIQRNTATPTVGIEAFFRAGVLWETEKNAGISNLMARVMLRGTRTRTAEQLSEELDSTGARMRVLSGNNTFGLSMALPARDVKQGIWLLAEVLRDASFPEEAVETEKSVSKMLIRREAGNWETEALRNFREAMFTRHPYRRHRYGSLDSIDRIDQEAVVNHHGSTCVPQNGVLAIFGDLDIGATERVVRAAFGDWKRSTDVARAVPVEPDLSESRIVTYPSSKGQVVICLGFPGAAFDSEDRWVLQVIDAAISGLGTSSGRLHEALRGKENLVYYVQAVNWNGFGTGAFYVICPCPPNLYDEVLGVIRREIVRIAEEGLTAEELQMAKRMCITDDHLRHQTNGERAQSAALWELYGFGWDAWTKDSAKIARITNDDVKRVASRHFEHSVLAITAPMTWLKKRGFMERKETLPDIPREK